MKKTTKRCVIICVLLLFATLAFAVTYSVHGAFESAEREELLQRLRDYYDAKIEQFERENEELISKDVEIVFLGDSLTDGYDLNKYYPQYKTANRGIGGDTTVGLEARLEISAYDLQPEVVVMLIGANNMDTMLDNYENILKGFKENLPDSEVVLLSLTAMGDEWGRKNQLAAYNNVSIKLLAEKYGYHFVDLFSPLYDVSRREVYEGYTVDGGHFTELGYTVVTEQITPVLASILGR